MTLSRCVPARRRKAVWGPKRTLAAVALLLIGFAPDALASGRQAEAGKPNSNVKNYKIDDELSDRASNPISTGTSKVIVELQPGAKLTGPLAAYARRNGSLGIINRLALELPPQLIRQLSQHPAWFRPHLVRPAPNV